MVTSDWFRALVFSCNSVFVKVIGFLSLWVIACSATIRQVSAANNDATASYWKPIGMKTILLVDDDQQLRTLFGSILRGRGYYVIEAESGSAGLEMARKHLPDLILSDIDMPGGDGANLLRHIRRDPQLKSKQFVLMSGGPDLSISCKDIGGVDDFLPKPVPFQKLLSCIKARISCTSTSLGASEQILDSDPLLDAA